MKRRTPDISKLRSIIDFDPAFSLDDILEDVIDEVKARRAASSAAA
jgi:nucleoside-diphosphate-sugar epimerase